MSALLFLAQTVRIAVPYLFAAAGGAIAERSGIVSLTLEGFMLGGAFGAALGAYYAGNAWAGVGAGVAAGMALGLVHAVASIRYKADQVVVGVAINLFAVG
ncbi:MAG TPA: ABC transporter permease, partial [Gemmatimonadaceae bacterium]